MPIGRIEINGTPLPGNVVSDWAAPPPSAAATGGADVVGTTPQKTDYASAKSPGDTLSLGDWSKRLTLAGAGTFKGFAKDAYKAARESLKALIFGGAKYKDINITLGVGPAFTGGVIYNAESGNLQWYGGVGLSTGPVSAMWTSSAQSVTPGWNIAVSGAAGPYASQLGLDPSGGIFAEHGWNVLWAPGASITGFYIGDGK